ncbi:MAG TPA: universal stress protein [Steroidobacteraceae bacterium]|nr:universal stress protein [Steroidobacteraceae bacterium]
MSKKRWQVILVVVTNPFAREQLAATKAAAVARRCGARVVLFNTFMVPQPVADVPMDSREQIIGSAIRQREQQLAQIVARLRLPRTTKCVVRWDYPIYEAIVRQVRQTKPDLLVTESHRHTKLARIVLANTDWQLMRECPCPLWFVRSPELPKQPRLLVAVDPRHTHAKPTRLDDRLLQAAHTLTRQLGGRIAMVHAYETPASAVPGISLQRTRDFIATTTQAVTKLADKHRVSAAACVVREGTASDVITAEANRRSSDVLVMGAVSRSLPARPVIGSTAERVIDHVDCDVLVIKPAGFESPVKRSSVKV